MTAFVDVDRVTKSFPAAGGPVQAVAEMTFQLHRGEFLAIVGPSGCGKSTLLTAAAGLTAPTSGQIRIAGEPVDGPHTALGMVFQNPELLPWRTALDNVLLQAEIRKLPKVPYRDAAARLLQQVGLGGFEQHYPDELSGGMAQRVALCRALLHDPELLLLDEPFGALDALTRDRIQLDLQRLWLARRKTVAFVTHSIDEAVFLADRVLVFSPRPAGIAADIDIGFDRPRRPEIRATPEFAALVGRIRDVFARLGVFGADPDDEPAADAARGGDQA
ncbi:ABC transporter ATP-binding protein [Saccharopolyspora sp. HNM0983]|uniref:ABC transporter ATP-binding protein n=1 Tax=Saccharopolyspora montiporae TaxID=2781240 RepID=A0A929B5F5_9PSEU|nr:ABC transporter ATP-binding protein [Saccharopolyspora sp. HNM0983]MBE9373517.1 ABC transporter ATP-binding protein [Saccharopolyspora sp. HNM0983]